MGSFNAISISILLISLPWLFMCEATEEVDSAAKGDERTQLNLNSQAGQIALFVGAVIVIDLFLTVFAFGHLSKETQKKYAREGIRNPYYSRVAAKATPSLRQVFRRRPSALALTLRRKLRQLGPNRNAPFYRHSFGKRAAESDIEREDIFRPAIDYEFNDDLVQQSIDIVGTTFGVMDVDSEACRKRTICEIERVASQNPIVSFFVKTVGPFVNGLEKYDDAAELGRNGEDCALHYDTCQYSMDKLPKFFQQQF